jgi:hypothetical protein
MLSLYKRKARKLGTGGHGFDAYVHNFKKELTIDSCNFEIRWMMSSTGLILVQTVCILLLNSKLIYGGRTPLTRNNMDHMHSDMGRS